MPQRSITWQKPDVERLIAWMEEHPEALRGKQAAWHKVVKEQVFLNDEQITAKKIGEKAQNMKAAWKSAREMQQRSGWGIRPEDNEASINGILERKCAFFRRLDAIWGIRPNATVIVSAESLSQPSQPTESSRRSSIQASMEPTPQASLASQETLVDDDDSQAFEWSPIPRSTPMPGLPSRSTTSALVPSSTSAPVPSSTSRSATPLTTPSRRSAKRVSSTIFEHLEKKAAAREKRHKAEMDIQRKRIEVEQRMVQIQADTQRQQMENFTRIIDRMITVLGGHGPVGFGGIMSGGSGGGIMSGSSGEHSGGRIMSGSSGERSGERSGEHSGAGSGGGSAGGSGGCSDEGSGESSGSGRANDD